MTLRPFVKAAGGKTKLVPEIMHLVPQLSDYAVYHEPFVGGGAVFLAMRPSWRMVLNDRNAELANAYEVVRDDHVRLEARLKEMKKAHCHVFYYQTRAREPTPTDALERAARFIYLNKTCFNGLWRVNAAGKFNVPMGDYKDPAIIEPGLLAHWAKALGGVEIYSEDFEPRLLEAKDGDFVYADPPYLPRSKTANFTKYTASGFGLKDHERLAAALGAASRRGVKFLCSQGDSEVVRSLYKDFEIRSVSVTHYVAAKGASRGKVRELLIRNYGEAGA